MLDASFFKLISVFFYILILKVGIKKQISFYRHIVIIFFYTYIIGMISITLFPIPIQKEVIAEYAELELLKNNFIPFQDINSMIKSNSTSVIYRQIIGNMVLFMPMGFLIPLVFNKMSTFYKVIFVSFFHLLQ
ncbi:hypothetical protein Dtox_0510 [Desulfofarcimen acetoxidans DSM 771]|uniref:VanZ-like domain-containing protein n=1 Tax=Desulfofarcimen acetoxidans (strain ATCC 49208 / DSM 771 / KCTC 5769 / VKM B-1644 / 5575) TaxID=485916 RepID=C8W5X6_DESAS|nr:VanZ family protein [Desulfofarcimen acetoxidans]ACV61431.1 hypothetical protein Dtox_0510 [Desulfofarcimen acetoxidans DSM 771]